MHSTARLLCLLIPGVLPAALVAQAPRPTVVVLTFENGGSYGLDSLDFSGLGRGIPAALTSDLARNPALRTVDRSEGQSVIERDGLGRGGRIDASTAARVAKQVGAAYVVTGTFVDYYGRVRIDARLIDGANGAILEVVSTGQRARAELPQMVADISSQLMSGSKLPALPAGTPAPARISADALVLFGRGVLAQDQGNKAEAVQYYEKALKLAPEFTAAKEGLQSVQ